LNVVAYQGEPGAYSEEAALALGGREAKLLPQAAFDDVVQAVLRGSASSGILPLENSLIGRIRAANAALDTPGVRIVGELTLPIHHCLLAKISVSMQSVRIALSHPAALAQCKAFFQTHPHIAAAEYYDTAGAAKHVATLNDASIAAIASKRAGEHYGLTVVAEAIEDSTDNRTRFIMFVKQ
jgi:prephenate dehydratase